MGIPVVRFEEIAQLGEILKHNNIEYISLAELYQILRRVTNTHDEKRLKYFAKLLRDEGYIKFTEKGWKLTKAPFKERLKRHMMEKRRNKK